MFTLNCNGRLLIIDTPIVMGVINITSDSFYPGSRHQTERDILVTAEKMLEEGATLLDIGGQSTKPGSRQISAEEELERVVPAITSILKRFPDAFVSVDTWYARVAKTTVAAGACMINDISAGNMDTSLLDVIATLNVPYVLMHMQGTPTTMQQQPFYKDVTREVLDFFIEKIGLLRNKGLKDIIIDPGYGFGKTIEHNFTLLKNQSVFEMLDVPVLIGVSRKSMIYKTLDTDSTQALNGTTVLHTIGLLNGASILRVHDVKEAAQTIKLIKNVFG